jgi:single-strand DNA-binding protein
MKKISIIGNVGTIDERATKEGESFVNFSVAVNTKERGQQVTDWFNCTAFGKNAETFLKYMNKGGKVYVCGVPSLRTYTTREGKQGASLEIRVTEFTMLNTQGDPGAYRPANDADNIPLPPAGEGDDDLPF